MSPKSLLISDVKNEFWTWRGAAPKVTERSANVETLSLHIANFEGVKVQLFQGRKQNLCSSYTSESCTSAPWFFSILERQNNRN